MKSLEKATKKELIEECGKLRQALSTLVAWLDEMTITAKLVGQSIEPARNALGMPRNPEINGEIKANPNKGARGRRPRWVQGLNDEQIAHLKDTMKNLTLKGFKSNREFHRRDGGEMCYICRDIAVKLGLEKTGKE